MRRGQGPPFESYIAYRGVALRANMRIVSFSGAGGAAMRNCRIREDREARLLQEEAT
jgi:hypothetical protein